MSFIDLDVDDGIRSQLRRLHGVSRPTIDRNHPDIVVTVEREQPDLRELADEATVLVLGGDADVVLLYGGSGGVGTTAAGATPITPELLGYVRRVPGTRPVGGRGRVLSIRLDPATATFVVDTPPRRERDRADRAGRPAPLPTLAILLAFTAAVTFVVRALTWGRSSFMDEEIMLTMGRRTWEGHLVTDGFRRWVTGSQLYPMLASAVADVGGLRAARALSGVLIATAAGLSAIAAYLHRRPSSPATAMPASASARTGVLSRTRQQSPPQAALAALLAVLASAPVLVLATQVTHDVGAVLCIAIAFAAAANFAATGNRAWVAVAALFGGLAGIVAYASLLMLVPLTLLLVVAPARSRLMTLGLIVMIGAAPPLVLATIHGADVDALRIFLGSGAGDLSSPRSAILAELVWVGATPLVLALVGVLSAWRDRSTRGDLSAPVYLLALLLMPAVHLASGVSQANVRHCAYGIVAAAPLLANGAGVLFRGRRVLLAPIVTIAVAAGALGQTWEISNSWADVTPVLDELPSKVAPSDVIISIHEWPIAGPLYRDGLLDTPWQVIGPDRERAEGGAFDVCTARWFVDDSSSAASAALRERVTACGTFVAVSTSTTDIWARDGIGIAGGPASITLWRNTRGQP